MQAGQAAAERGLLDLQLTLRHAEAESDLAVRSLASEQQQIASAVRLVSAELAAYQQHDLVARLTVGATQLV